MGRPKMRRRRPEPESEAPDTVADLTEIPLHHWIDPRALLALGDSEPAEVRGDDAARLTWYRKHHPQLVRSEAEGRAEVEHLERMRRYREARREARLRGVPAPELADSDLKRWPSPSRPPNGPGGTTRALVAHPRNR